jgi:NTE family protein
MRKILCFLLIALFVVSPSMAERKKVAVVLGGGGAKGVAHIGVLKVLEEAGMPIDYIVGTSMGAIVGGLYAVGYTASEIDSMVNQQDWTMLLSDQVERSSQSFPEKENTERYILSLPFGKEKKDRIISGVIKGQHLQNLFSSLTIGYHESLDFNTFPIPFACVAVDVVNGEEYVFRKGSLPLAMRASMAIPAVFTPVRLDSMVLIDGGIKNNYPADIALAMGADIIIGVDLGTNDLKLLENINTPAEIVSQIVALNGYDKYSHNRDMTDLLFRPDMAPYSSASFSRNAIDSLIRRGEEEARKRWDEILALKQQAGVSGDTGGTLSKQAGIANRTDTFFIRTVSFMGVDPRDEEWLARLCGLKDNSLITLRKLQQAISILMGTDAYSHVSYKLTGDEPYDLQFIVQQKSISSINLGIRLDTEEVAAGLLNATLDYRGRNHSRLAFTGRVGKTSYARLDYALERTPLRNLNLSYMFKYQDLDIYKQGKKTYNTTYTYHLAELAYSDMNWLNFRVKAGLRYEYFNYSSFLYTGENEDYSVKPEGYISYFLLAHLETLDRRYFPTKGVSLQANYSIYTDNFIDYNNDSPFSSVAIDFTSVLPLYSHLALIPSLYGRGLIGGNLAYPFLNAVGGETASKYLPQQLPFAGINHVELFDNIVAVARLHLRQRIGRRHYFSLIGNYAVHHNTLLELVKGRSIWGGSIGYAYNSIAGPLNASFGLSDWNRRVQFYLNLGYSF